MGKCNSPLKQPVRNTWSLVYAVSSHTDRTGRPSARGLVHRLSSVEWSDTRRRIGASFTRTSQAFARFNPEIRTGAAELVEHSARRPRHGGGRSERRFGLCERARQRFRLCQFCSTLPLEAGWNQGWRYGSEKKGRRTFFNRRPLCACLTVTVAVSYTHLTLPTKRIV